MAYSGIQYEYKLLTVKIVTELSGYVVTAENGRALTENLDLLEYLNKLGREGWQVDLTSLYQPAKEQTLVLMRAIS